MMTVAFRTKRSTTGRCSEVIEFKHSKQKKEDKLTISLIRSTSPSNKQPMRKCGHHKKKRNSIFHYSIHLHKI